MLSSPSLNRHAAQRLRLRVGVGTGLLILAAVSIPEDVAGVQSLVEVATEGAQTDTRFVFFHRDADDLVQRIGDEPEIVKYKAVLVRLGTHCKGQSALWLQTAKGFLNMCMLNSERAFYVINQNWFFGPFIVSDTRQPGLLWGRSQPDPFVSRLSRLDSSTSFLLEGDTC